jgi:aminodeoxyfutalosine deaminase
MRRITADYLFPVSSPPVKNGILVLDDEDRVHEIIHPHGDLRESANVEMYNGILLPGFVNVHTHLELSYLRNAIPLHTGLTGFIDYIIHTRPQLRQDAVSDAKEADRLLWETGIMAAGDISSDTSIFPLKADSRIQYVNFVETLDIGKSSEEILEAASKLVDLAHNLGMAAFMSPHAPYSVSAELFAYIGQKASPCDIISFHNQESPAEDQLFMDGEGDFRKFYDQRKLPVPVPSGKSSLQTILPLLPAENHILAIHNTYTAEEDIVLAVQACPHLFWGLCPNANLYISKSLPPIDLFRKYKARIAIGTDSYASNANLSMLEELKTIQLFHPYIPLPELIDWATLNGAQALNLCDNLGSFDPGKKPGVLLLQHTNLHQLKLTHESVIKRLV